MTFLSARGRAWAPVLVAAGLSAPRSVLALEPSFGAHDIATLFFIAKSDDRNRVDYGMRLDARFDLLQDPMCL